MGPIEARWRQSNVEAKAIARLAGLVAASPLFPSALSAQLDPRPLGDSQANARPRRDGQTRSTSSRSCSRTCRSPSTIHRDTATVPSSRCAATARRSNGSTSSPAKRSIPPPWICRAEILWAEDEVPDHDSRRRRRWCRCHPDGEIGMQPSRHRAVEYADDRQPQHEHVDRTDCPRARPGRCGVAVSTVAEPRGQPGNPRRRGSPRVARRSSSRSISRRRTTSDRCRIGILAGEGCRSWWRRPRRRWRTRRGRAGRWRGGPGRRRAGTVSPAAWTALVTRGVISTTFARS